jgi:hypothetical protein
MPRFSLRHLQLVCLAMLVCSIAPPVTAAPKSAPFQATIGFLEQLSLPDPVSPCLFIGQISGDGNAANLGNLHLSSTDCIVPLATNLFIFSSQQVVLTLTGGEIWATYGGTLTVDTGVIAGLFFIHGGTGRFVRATGAGTISGREALDPSTGGRGEIQLTGTLSY